MQTSLYNFEDCVRCEWYWFAMRGTIAFLFGFMAIIWPIATLWAIALFWGAFVFTDGAFSLLSSWRIRKKGVRWWPYFLLGVSGVLAGIITFAWPNITATALIYIIAVWALFGGITQVLAAVRLRDVVDSEWVLALSGLISVIFGLLIFSSPVPEGVMAIAWMVGFFAIVVGMLHTILAIKIKNKAM